MWKLCLSSEACARSNPRALRPAAPVPAALIFRKSRRVTCGTQFPRWSALAGDYATAYRSAKAVSTEIGDTVGLEMNDWFEALSRRFAEAATERGAPIAPPELDPQVADEVLELARVAAHTKERRFAPLACFMAGVAVERLRQAGSISAVDETAYLRVIREGLEEG